MQTRQIWISPNSNWWRRIHNPNNTRDSLHTQSKKDAIEAAKRIAENQNLDLKMQKRTWEIQKNP